MFPPFNKRGESIMNQEHGHEHMSHITTHQIQNVSSVENEVFVEWKSYPENILPNHDVEITMTIKDKQGISATSFTVVHEKQMHLLAISKDLSSFQHLHPEYRGDGIFVAKMQFPKAGNYKLFADFMLEGSTQQLATFEIETLGEKAKESIEQDRELKKTVKDLHFELKFDFSS